MKLITNKDLRKIADFPESVQPEKWVHHYENVINTDFERLPQSLRAALLTLAATEINVWQPSISYQVGDKVRYNDLIYTAKNVNQNIIPQSSSDWELMQLSVFWKMYVSFWLSSLVYADFVSMHGFNTLPFNMAAPTDPTYSQIQGTQRATIATAYKSKAETYWNRIDKYLKNNSYTIDGVKYEDECRPSRSNMPIFTTKKNVSTSI
jgi:hypothetical protein